MLTTVLLILYVLFSVSVAIVLGNKNRKFWAVFLLSLGLTPLVVGTVGLFFAKDD